MTATESALDEVEVEHLRAVQREYGVTIRVLAVVVELLLAAVGGDSIEISDDTLADSPDLQAWRETERCVVAITVSRKAPSAGDFGQ